MESLVYLLFPDLKNLSNLISMNSIKPQNISNKVHLGLTLRLLGQVTTYVDVTTVFIFLKLIDDL